MLCYDEGFDDFDIRYIGGLWVIMEFKHKDACKNFLESGAMGRWIVEKRPWDRNFVPLHRLIWVDVEGLPLRAWKVMTFNIDGHHFLVRIKEALGWTPSFAWENKVTSDGSSEHGNGLEYQDENLQAGDSVKHSNPAATIAPSLPSVLESRLHEPNQELNAKTNDTPIGFSGSFGRLSSIVDSEDNLTHPQGFSNSNNLAGCLDASYNKGSFLCEIQKTMEMGKAMGYDLEGCYDRVKEIVEGVRDKIVLR
ncbi:unnamed protein product [Lactuca saligna]|uniref:DUF4283 domain-containing protein n=1 Tax=Lactuca saligna TaxID=75948 RepID=A0AA35YTL6_LACSI|nr:unnamed protein product [Lactuca saligna]